MKDLSRFIENARKILDSHALGQAGAYRRWLWQNKAGTRELGLNEYGCADAANILYIIGEFPRESAERSEWIDTLQSLQDEGSGLFQEATHHPIHTTAHCIAALELFGAMAANPLRALEPYLEKERLYGLLEALDWAGNPWTASHQGAGIYAALVLQEEASREWQSWYFDWLMREADPETGLWRRGAVRPVLSGDSFSSARREPSLFPHLASSFHYLFNHEYARMPLKFPDKMIDTCLEIRRGGTWPSLGRSLSFAEIDWCYCLNRASRQTGHRFAELKSELLSFAESYIDYLESLEPEKDEGLNDLHCLFGCLCALAELQATLPGYLLTGKPLRLVLDRRPFI